MDSDIKELTSRERGKVITFYCPAKLVKQMDEILAQLEPHSRSALINVCLKRHLSSVAQQLGLRPHINLSAAPRGRDRLKVLEAKNAASGKP